MVVMGTPEASAISRSGSGAAGLTHSASGMGVCVGAAVGADGTVAAGVSVAGAQAEQTQTSSRRRDVFFMEIRPDDET